MVFEHWGHAVSFALRTLECSFPHLLSRWWYRGQGHAATRWRHLLSELASQRHRRRQVVLHGWSTYCGGWCYSCCWYLPLRAAPLLPDCPLIAIEQKLYALDLTSSFVVDSCILGSQLKQTDAPADSNWNGTGVFSLNANETLLYTFGGFQDNGPPRDALPLYSKRSESWDIVTVPGEPLNRVIGMVPCSPALWAALKT